MTGAIDDYSKAIQYNPIPDLFNDRGEVLFAVGRYRDEQSRSHDRLEIEYRDALKDFEKAQAFNPGFLMPIAGMAIAYHALGDVEKAKRLWNSLMGINSNYRNAAWVQATLNWS